MTTGTCRIRYGALTGITRSMLAGAPSAPVTLKVLEDRLTRPPYLLVAQGAHVEAGLIHDQAAACPTLARIPLLCTVTFGTPLTLAETASVFGETVTFGRLLDATDDPAARLALLAESLEGQIATVFRQVAMNRFEELVHTARREQGPRGEDTGPERGDPASGGRGSRTSR